MKKRPCLLDSDWKKYDDHFSDLLVRCDPIRKKSKKNIAKSYEKCDPIDANENFNLDDGNISWQSSLNDDKFPDDELSSPVMSGGKAIAGLGGYCVKSTPAGSPILSQSCNNVITKKAAPRRLSLVPLSPITPETRIDFSFQNTSHFSIHLHEESRTEQVSTDQTPLALPLPDSDNEEEDFDVSLVSSTNHTTTQEKIEQFSTQNSSTADNPQISTAESSENDPSTLDGCLSTGTKVRGSDWVQNIMGKMYTDQQSTSRSKSSVCQMNANYDSGKKQKLIRNGLAERLQQVCKQEQTQKVLFKHQLKQMQKQPGPTNRSITLKVLSHHKDGLLHVLECKVVGSGEPEPVQRFYTVILNNKEVMEHALDLTSVFTIYPPWKEMHLDQHNFPVLICVYHIVMETFPSSTPSQSQRDTVDEPPVIRTICDCESLLEALEKKSDSGVSLAATIQRKYQQPTPTGLRWIWLCEDAFGVFFELSLETQLGDDVSWSRMIAHGEGQRLYFRKIFLTGRVTREQSPSLFSLINSVWDPEGFGLQQVQNSQSQANWATTTGRLHGLTACPPLKTGESRFSHGPNKRACLLSLQSALTLLMLNAKCSFLVAIIHLHSNRSVSPCDEDLSSQLPESSPLLFVADHTTLLPTQIIPISIAPQHCNTDIRAGTGVLLKDLNYHPELGYRADTFSQLTIFNKIDEEITSDHHLVADNEMYGKRFRIQLPLLPLLDKNVDPGCFVTVAGVICGLSAIRSRDDTGAPPGGGCPPPSKKVENTWKDNDVSASNDYSFEIFVMVNLNVKVKLQSHLETSLNLLPKHSTKLPKGKSSLNGLKFGPVNCYVYAKYVKTHLTLFYAEEVTY